MTKKPARKRPGRHRRAPEEVPATAFKDSCLRLIDQVHQTREEIVVTKHGRPVAKLVAYDESKTPLFGHLGGTVTVLGDIIQPVDEAWDVQG